MSAKGNNFCAFFQKKSPLKNENDNSYIHVVYLYHEFLSCVLLVRTLNEILCHTFGIAMTFFFYEQKPGEFLTDAFADKTFL